MFVSKNPYRLSQSHGSSISPHQFARHCSLIDGVDLFDNKLFGLSLAETKGPVRRVVPWPELSKLLGLPRWSLHSQVWRKGNTFGLGIQCRGMSGVYLIFRHIHVWSYAQGSPQPPCSQMVPSRLVAWGGPTFPNNMASVCAALSGHFKECMENGEYYGVICREYQ